MGLLAHAANVSYDFPLPVWLYALAGGVVVAVSAPAAAFAVRGRGTWTSRDFYRPLSHLHLGAIGTVLATLVLADAFIGGWWGDPVSFTANPMPLVFWVDFWVGVGLVSGLFGNIWDFISPLSWAGRALDRALARRGTTARAYPEWLGVWPSVVLLLLFSWMELVWERGTRPHNLVIVLGVYIVGQLIGMALFGAEAWLARAELFTVLARTFSRFAPLEYVVRAEDGEIIGRPDAWLAADRSDRGTRLRGYGAGIRRESPLLPGGGAFVVATLATVVFDGYHSSKTYASLIDRIFPGQQAGSESVGTLAMIVIVGGFLLAFVAVSALVSVFEDGSIVRTAERYAPTLIPIAAVYFAAHYFLYFFYLGQLTPGTLADPFEKDWVPDYNPWQPLSGAAVWWTQVVLIVFGHVVAIVEAHRVSVTVQHRSRDALVAQIPFVILMVAYTFSGLWVLGQSLQVVS